MFKKVFAAMNLLYGGIKEEECKSNQDHDSCGDLEVSFESANFEVNSDTDDENENVLHNLDDVYPRSKDDNIIHAEDNKNVMKDSDSEINKNYYDECDQIMREVFHGDDEKIITGLIFETVEKDVSADLEEKENTSSKKGRKKRSRVISVTERIEIEKLKHPIIVPLLMQKKVF